MPQRALTLALTLKVYCAGGSRVLNEPAGHLLRAKLGCTDEGGVAAGFACLSSPLLVDDNLLFPALPRAQAAPKVSIGCQVLLSSEPAGPHCLCACPRCRHRLHWALLPTVDVFSRGCPSGSC